MIRFLLITLCLFFICASDFVAQSTERVGVLVLAHGGSSSWQKAVEDAIKPIQSRFTVAIAFGMAEPSSIEVGLKQLKTQSVDKVVVVPLFISTHSPIIRQTEYLLGFRTELADEPMLAHNHNHSNVRDAQENCEHHTTQPRTKEFKEVHHHKSATKLEPIKVSQKLIFAKPLDAHPLIAEILSERVLELSSKPDSETIVLVAHGPNDEFDNRGWIESMENLSEQMKEIFGNKGKRFKQIFCVTVRDDAPTEIFEQAKENLRNIVRQAGKDSDVLVVPLLLASNGAERKIVARLEGLKYKWNGKALLPHPNITKFIEQSIETALADGMN